MPAVLEAKNVTKIFGGGFLSREEENVAVNNISMSLDKKINDCDLIIIAVKPTQYKKVCNAINNYVNKKKLLILNKNKLKL